jgi:hypothetical protein
LASSCVVIIAVTADMFSAPLTLPIWCLLIKMLASTLKEFLLAPAISAGALTNVGKRLALSV